MAVIKRKPGEAMKQIIKKERQKTLHDELVERAEKWLKSKGCGVTIREPFRAATKTSETPDAIGWRSGVSILIECKASRSDFFSDAKKPFRILPENGMGDWRFYLCPPEIINPCDLPDNWGLLWVYPDKIKAIIGVPKGNCSWGENPFIGNKRSENAMLVSACRRMIIRGHFKEIYDKMPKR